jgi:hypothetical protein
MVLKTVKTFWQFEQRTAVPVSLIRSRATRNLVWQRSHFIISMLGIGGLGSSEGGRPADRPEAVRGAGRQFRQNNLILTYIMAKVQSLDKLR